MKKRFLPVCLALLVLYCLLFPARMAHAVADGLSLWYHSVLPTLLPFCIFSNLIIRTGVYDRVFDKLHPVFRHVYPVRAPLIYPMLAGFLFGFPLGSKICADLYASGKISAQEAETTSCITNNFGPAFLYNYVAVGLLDVRVPAWILFACFYVPPLALGRIAIGKDRFPCRQQAYNPRKPEKRLPKNRHDAKHPDRIPAKNPKKPPSESSISMKILDAGIMDGFTTMLKLAGYILLSALLADLLKALPLTDAFLSAIGTGVIEITNGISCIASLDAGLQTKTMLAVGIVNFGGISGLLQTSSMMKATGFRPGRYLAFKLMCSAVGILMASILL